MSNSHRMSFASPACYVRPKPGQILRSEDGKQEAAATGHEVCTLDGAHALHGSPYLGLRGLYWAGDPKPEDFAPPDPRGML